MVCSSEAHLAVTIVVQIRIIRLLTYSEGLGLGSRPPLVCLP